MCLFKKKRKINKTYVVTERSYDPVPYSIPIISLGESNRDNPNARFVSSIYGTDVKDEVIISTTTEERNINNITSMNDVCDDIPVGFKTIQPRKKEEKETESRPRSALDILNELDRSEDFKDEVIPEEVDEYKVYTEPTPTPIYKEKETYKSEESFDEYRENDEEVNTESVQSEASSSFDSLTINDLKTINSLHKQYDYSNYVAPSIDLLDDPTTERTIDEEWVNLNKENIDRVLFEFKIGGHVEEYTVGPTFTRYAVKLDPGVSGSKIVQHEQDIERELAVGKIRIENPIPGKPFIGIEISNKDRKYVTLKEVLNRDDFKLNNTPLLIPTGLDVEGQVTFTSIENPPHGMIAGTSGSGKSVFLNTLILSLIYKYSPNDLRFMFIDPKQVDIAPYASIPHLMTPIVQYAKEGMKLVRFLKDEMDRRYEIFRITKTHKLSEYNELAAQNPKYPKIPAIVFVVEEAGSFLEECGRDLENIIVDITNRGRAAGIHVFLSMQKPIAKTLSTRIKSNLALRFAFNVTNFTDSQLILEQGGAEALLPYGDMLFVDGRNMHRYQAANVSNEEVERIIQYLSRYPQDIYYDPFEEEEETSVLSSNNDSKLDPVFKDACRYIVSIDKGSINLLQKEFNLSWFRASSMMSEMENIGIVGESKGPTPREVLVGFDELEEILSRF